MALNERQTLFCEYYVANHFNATKAALLAGYSKDTAYQQGHALLKNPEIREKIQEAIDLAVSNLKVTQERIIREYARIAFGDTREIAEWGWLGLNLKDSALLTEDQAAMVSKVKEKRGANGVSVEIEFHDKLNALEKLGKLMNMFVERTDITGVVTVIEPTERDRTALQHFLKNYSGAVPPAPVKSEENYDDIV